MTMTSLQRSRSLRNPTTRTTTGTDVAARNKEAEPRLGSPSRLPVKPLTRSATTASSTSRTLRSAAPTAKSASTSTSSNLARSATTSAHARSLSVRKPPAPSQPPVKRETSRYPPSTTTTRTRSAVRPTSSDGTPTQTKRAPTHTRAKSSTTATATAALRNTPVLRPPSGASTSSTSSTNTRTVTSRKVSGSSKPAAAPAQAQAQPRLRPAFTTLQQHYSPAKSSAPKPLTATYLAPPSPSKLPANVAASAETNKLQTELLQLHILHRDAAAVDDEWRESAKQKLGERFAKVAAQGARVDEEEKADVEKENVLALRSWAVGGKVEERIQTLDAVINGVWTLGEPGGRYARVIRRFERWVDQMCEVEDARRGDGALLQEQAILFIGEIDAAWKDECEGLIRRLENIRRQLEELGQVPEEEGQDQSSLMRMVNSSQTLVDGMLRELNLMEEIEREALAREEEWIERMNRDNGVDDTPGAGAVWRVV